MLDETITKSIRRHRDRMGKKYPKKTSITKTHIWNGLSNLMKRYYPRFKKQLKTSGKEMYRNGNNTRSHLNSYKITRI